MTYTQILHVLKIVKNYRKIDLVQGSNHRSTDPQANVMTDVFISYKHSIMEVSYTTASRKALLTSLVYIQHWQFHPIRE